MFIKFPRENIIRPLRIGKGYINTLWKIYPLMGTLEIIFVGEKSIPNHCWNLYFFSKTLASNPIDFYSLMSTNLIC
jgi:hypothetical protein